MIEKIKFAFLGNGPLAENALLSLLKNNLIPNIIITTLDKKEGRNLNLKNNILKELAIKNKIPILQIASFKDFVLENSALDPKNNFDVFIVVSFPKILKENILNIPKFGCLNIHPSLLPKYRGPSPIQSALINGDTKTGISIIKINQDIDAGEILIQTEIDIKEEETNEILEKKYGEIGGDILSQILKEYCAGNMLLENQDHSLATHTKKFEKKDGEIFLDDKAKILQNKFKALLPHISIFFYIEKNNSKFRIKITKINLEKENIENKLAKDIILKVIPEGKKEISWEDFQRGYLK